MSSLAIYHAVYAKSSSYSTFFSCTLVNTENKLAIPIFGHIELNCTYLVRT